MEELTFNDEAGFTEWDENGLRCCSFYLCVLQHTSDWTLQRLHDTATNSQQLLQAILKII
jgi:type I restriction enzyme M protein